MWSLKPLNTKDALERQEVLACRACLATGVVLYNIHENNLTEDYVQIVGVELHDRFPQQLCCYCVALLQKSAAFRDRCRNAYDLLMDICYSGKPITIPNIQHIQNSHKEVQVPYALSKVEIEEVPIEEWVTDELLTDEPNITITNDDTVNTEACLPSEITIPNIQHIQNSHKEVQVPYALSKVEIEEVPIEEWVTDELLTDEPNITITNNDTVNTELKNEFDDCYSDDDENRDIDEANDNDDDIDMTIGDLIDANDKELEVIEKKWMKGEYMIENLNSVVDTSLEKLRQSGRLEDCDLEPLDRMPTWMEHIKMTDAELMSLARMHDFKAVFLRNREEQVKEVEEMKQRRGAVCRLCGMLCMHRMRLNKHTRNLHNPAYKIVCEICGARFEYMTRLRYHIFSHRVTYHCSQCDYKTKNRLDMPRHQSRHRNERFMCEECGTWFLKIGALNKHMRIRHSTSKPWCGVCGQAAVNKLGLETHMRIAHKHVATVRCDKCSAEFVSASALAGHAAGGCGGRGCAHCGRALGGARALRLHLLLVHHGLSYTRGSLGFDCTDCEVTFHSSKGLDTHKDTCGLGVHCVQCGENFEDWRGLEEHAKEHVDTGLVCDECGVSCRTTGYYQRHYYQHRTGRGDGQGTPNNHRYFKQHKYKLWGVVGDKLVAQTPEGQPVVGGPTSFICHVCGKGYAGKQQLDYHLRWHTGEGMLQCERCHKQFARKTTLRTNLTEKRHVCQICGKRFPDTTRVKVHIKSVHMRVKSTPKGGKRTRETTNKNREDSRKVEEQSKIVEYECVVYDDSYGEEAEMTHIEVLHEEE